MGQSFSLELLLEHHVGHGPFQLVLQNGQALIEAQVVLGVDELAVHGLVRLVYEVHAEVVGVGAALERSIEGTVVFAGLAD